MFSNKILSFYQQLKIQGPIPKGIVVMNPYRDKVTMDLCTKFYHKYYDDQLPRTLLVGINPGRFGSGTTGISFTDPVKLKDVCGIPNTLPKKAELSADFIYKMIAAYGGPESFYQKYFVSAVSPLGFTRHGKNINYYDDKKLESAVTPFATKSMQGLLGMNLNTQKCFCIGEGKNFDFLTKLNNQHQWFQEIIPLPHPRFIMQYRRKKVDEYIQFYLKQLS